MYVYERMYLHICACVWENHGLKSDSFTVGAHSIVETSLLLNLELMDCMGWLACVLQESTQLSLPQNIEMCAAIPGFYKDYISRHLSAELCPGPENMLHTFLVRGSAADTGRETSLKMELLSKHVHAQLVELGPLHIREAGLSVYLCR